MDKNSMDDILADEYQDIIARKLIDVTSAMLDTIDKYDDVELGWLMIQTCSGEGPFIKFSLKYND